MKLMIVESPNKTAKIASILGKDWKVMASVGHVRDLPAKSMGVSLSTFVAEYEPTERGRGVIAKLKAAAREAEEVYLATDPDREGEAISWHLQQALGLKSYKRVTFNEITKTGVMTGLQNVRQIDGKLVAAQEARRVLDRLVGYSVSPELCRIFNDRLSAGRVQSVANKILVLREREIRNFVSKKHFGVEATFAGPAGDWKAQWDFSNMVGRDQHIWDDRSFAEKIATLRNFKVIDCVETEQRKGPFAPFTTSTLQQGASASLNMASKKCMELAQELFAAGLITYHRTDSQNLSKEAIAEIRQFASANNLPLPDAPRTFKSKDGAQEAHEAIRPTHIEDRSPQGLSGDALRLYEMIWKRAVACQLADAVYDQRRVTLSAGEANGKEVIFKATGSLLKFKGWKAVMMEAQENEDEADPAMSNPVPKVEKGVALVATDSKLLEKQTQPPPRYTEAKLVKKLEDEGIGRPSTYAATIDGLLKRGYVETKKKLMIPTPLGEKVHDELDGKFSFMELPFTRKMEEDLDLIAEGKAGYRDVLTGAYGKLVEELPVLKAKPSAAGYRPAGGGQPAATDGPKCPECENGFMRRIKGPSGYFWGCSAYREGCKCTRPDNDGKMGERGASSDGPRTPAKQADFNCEKCGSPMLERFAKASGKRFYGCSGYPKCTHTVWPEDKKAA
jgi:DNA topoisomerase-1